MTADLKKFDERVWSGVVASLERELSCTIPNRPPRFAKSPEDLAVACRKENEPVEAYWKRFKEAVEDLLAELAEARRKLREAKE